MINIALFASGVGSNVDNIIRFFKEKADYNISFVFSQNEFAPVLQKAQHLDVKTFHFPCLEDRSYFEEKLLTLLKEHSIDLVCLCGYMKIIGPTLLNQFPNIMNIHPSYLPFYQGRDAIKRAWDENASFLGVSVHWIDSGIDTGPLIMQKKFLRSSVHSFEQCQARIKELEFDLYPKAIMQFKEQKDTNEHL